MPIQSKKVVSTILGEIILKINVCREWKRVEGSKEKKTTKNYTDYLLIVLIS